MDLHDYVSGLSLALWCAGLPAPLPDLEAEVVPHGHDLCITPLLERVGVRVPDEARAAFEGFTGPHLVTQTIDDDPHRVATGWLDDDLMIGAERHDGGLHARGQYHPATVHWRQPGGGVGWLRLVHHGPTRATAAERSLLVECAPHPRHGPQGLHWESNVEATEVHAERWSFPGVDVRVATDAILTDASTRSYTASTDGPTTMTLAFA